MRAYTKHLLSLPALIVGLCLMPVGWVPAQPFTFGPQVQSTISDSLTYNSANNTFEYTGPADSTDDHAYLPLTGTAAASITTLNDWTSSLNINLSARSLTSTTTKTPDAAIGLYIINNNSLKQNIGIQLDQANNAGQSVSSDVPNDFYGVLAKFTARPNGDPPADTTTLGTSEHITNGASDQLILGGTDDSAATESIGAIINGVLTLTFDAASDTLTGYYNGSPVGSYSLAIWGSNPSLTLLVVGFSEETADVPAGTATASDFYAGTSPPQPIAIITTNAAFGFTKGVFGFDVSGPSGSNVVIQASTALQTWIPLQTNLLGSGLLYFSDAQSPASVQRFYRARLLP